MGRAFRRILLVIFLAGIVVTAASAWWLTRAGDPEYTAYETIFHDRFHHFDQVIIEVARQRGMDPAVVKAVAWRESRFRPEKVGLDGERGLMQITDAAAREWAKSEHVTDFVPTDLFNPKTNLLAGTWLLARAMHRYSDHDNPLVFALAEYNAGRSRVAKWTGDLAGETAESGPVMTGQQLLSKINIASTRSYIETVENRVRFYHARGGL